MTCPPAVTGLLPWGCPASARRATSFINHDAREEALFIHQFGRHSEGDMFRSMKVRSFPLARAGKCLEEVRTSCQLASVVFVART